MIPRLDIRYPLKRQWRKMIKNGISVSEYR